MVNTFNEDPATKPLFDTIDTLRHFDLKTNEIPIPQLVVVGDQSSGKSSVLESIEQVSLLRRMMLEPTKLHLPCPKFMCLRNRIIPDASLIIQSGITIFVGYVNALVVQGIILKGLRDTIFTTEIVGELDAKTVQRVAGETLEISERRAALQNEITQLEGVLGVLKPV
ncbi:uncharacterized protein APUU_61071A [Aspergillus puulaauensis]|uniref:GED domain-containing protein n=1 Tax=Aspergillus puulaauensis TaxID=1220207 RepID=A0A7R7XW31_9EURO|nr:uncharacterized protein APUU_61071A [Aspergillus puulaauensis]BCS28023.1 hypothetical protein APUU_61071A [Aspergillus puulaauensis]